MVPLLIPLSICFALGINLALLTGLTANFLAFGVLIFLGLSIYFTKARTWLVCLMFLFLGAWRFSVVEEKSNQQSLIKIAGDTPLIIKARGKVVSTPAEKISDIQTNIVLRTSCQFLISHVLTDSTWLPAHGRIAMNVRGDCEILKGDVAEAEGLILKPRGPIAPGLFDYSAWLKSQGILYEFQVESSNEVRVISRDFFGRLTGQYIAWAKENLARGLPERDKALGLQWAMVLGWRSGLQGEVKEPYLRSGTMHIFAISGMHIAAMAGILLVLLKACRLPRRFAGLITIPILWFYAAATGWQPSAIRASVMMTIVITGWVISRPPSLLNSLAASALLLLLYDPRELFHPGFQLSFMVVAALGIIPLEINKHVPRLAEGDPFIPQRLVPGYKRVVRQFSRNAVQALIFSFSATLGSVPLIMYYFNLVTPISLFSNLVVAPLSFVALASAIGSLLTGWFAPWIAEIFNHSTWFWMLAMDKTSAWFAAIPFGSWHVQKPPMIFILNYYLAIACLLRGLSKKRRVFLWSALALFFASLFNLAAPIIKERKITTITVLPLGGGESIYINQPGSKTDMLIDSGDRRGAITTVEFLHARGRDHISNFILTHGDVRNAGGASYLLERIPAAVIHHSAANFRSIPYKQEVSGLTNKFNVQIIDAGDMVGGWKVLHPGTNLQHRLADDIPVVLLGNLSGVKVLCLSDLSPQGQRTLVERFPELRADVLVSGMPSQGEPVVQDFLEIVRPQVVIISDADYPWGHHATKAVRERLASQQVFYCSDEGAITLQFMQNQWALATMSGRRAIFQKTAY